MKIYKVVKREENPTITISDANMEDGFMLVSSDGRCIGMIVYDSGREEYILVTCFYDSFRDGIEVDYHHEDLEELMRGIKSDYCGAIEFNYIKVEA
jgi:hypothetical protein